MRSYQIGLALAVAFLMTYFTTPDITDYHIDFHANNLIGRFGIYFVLSYALINITWRLVQKNQGDETPEFPEITFAPPNTEDQDPLVKS